jgi:hypothetical protein
VAEIGEMLQKCGMQLSPEELNEVVAEFDEDGSGAIDFDEFLQIFVRILQSSSGSGSRSSSSSSSSLAPPPPVITKAQAVVPIEQEESQSSASAIEI